MKIYKNTYAMGITYGVYDTETKEVSWANRNMSNFPEREPLFHALPSATTEKWFMEKLFTHNHGIMANFGEASYSVEIGQRTALKAMCEEMGGDKVQQELVAEYNKVKA